MLKDQLDKLLAKAEDAHAKANADYKKCLKEKSNAEKKLRKSCERASVTANELAALRKAVSDLPPPNVTGSGDVKAQAAGAH